MSLIGLRTRLVRRISSPVEILYDISSHWFIVSLALVLGTIIMLARTVGEPPVHECSATLVLNPNEVPFQIDPRRAPRGPDMNFITEQLALLQSDSVLEKVATRLGDDSIIRQELDPRQDRRPGWLERTYRSLTSGISGMMESMQPLPGSTQEERQRQRAKLVFRRNSQVLNERRSNIVTLTVRGTERARLKDMLQVWIDCYRARIDEISRETYHRLFNERLEVWALSEKEAMQKLDEFRQRHPDVSLARQEWNRERVVRLKWYLDEVQRQMAGGEAGQLLEGMRPPPFAAAPRAAVEQLLHLKRERDRLDVELTLLRSKVPEKSIKLRDKEAALRDLDEEIQRREDPLAAEKEEAGDGEPVKAEDILAKRAAFLNEQLDQAIAEQNSLDQKMGEFTSLTLDHQRALEVKRGFQDKMDGKIEETESRKMVDIKVQDKPSLSPTLAGGGFAPVALGALGGAWLGVLLAFGIEFFGGKVRFKRDLEEELGLKVIGVIPGE